jgi:hypothetical protein
MTMTPPLASRKNFNINKGDQHGWNSQQCDICKTTMKGTLQNNHKKGEYKMTKAIKAHL